MTLEDLLLRFDAVRQRGAGRWSARCPAHDDKTPSLSVRGGDRGILIKCFSGCTNPDIVAALGLTMADLFFDAPTHHANRSLPRPAKPDRVALAWRFEVVALDLHLRAERIVEAGKAMPVATLTDEELDRALTCMARGYADMERAELFEGVAADLRARDFSERKARERHTCAARANRHNTPGTSSSEGAERFVSVGRGIRVSRATRGIPFRACACGPLSLGGPYPSDGRLGVDTARWLSFS